MDSSRTGARRPSPALVVAVIALIASLAGGAYAVSLKKNQVKTRNIAPRAVTTAKLAPKAVGSSRLADRAVKSAKLAPGAVDARALAASSVGAGALAAGSVGQTALADDAVTRQKIRAQAVGTPKITDGAVESQKLADGAVSAAKLAPGSVGSGSVLLAFTANFDQAALPAEGCAPRRDFAQAAVQPGDSVIVTPAPGLPDNVVLEADAGAGEVGLRLCAIGAGADPDPLDYRFLVIR